MLKIRLQRVGRKHDPSYRVVLIDSRRGPKSGKFLENLGFYDTIRKVRQIKVDRVKHWIANGAQVSDTVHNILVSEKIIKAKKKNVLPKKTPIIKEVEEEPSDAKAVEDKEVKEKAPKETLDEGEKAEETKEEVVEEVEKTEEATEEKVEAEAPAEETKEEVPTEEKKEEVVEDKKEEIS